MLVKERVLKSQKIKPKNKNNNVIVIFFITLLFALTLYISIFELKVIIFDLLLITIIIFGYSKLDKFIKTHKKIYYPEINVTYEKKITRNLLENQNYMPNSCNIRRHITKNYYSRVSYYNKSPHNYYAENYYSRASNFLGGLYLFLLILMPFLKEIALFSLIISFSGALILDMIGIIITYYNTKWIWTSYNRDETIKLIPTKPEKQLIKH